MLRISQRVLVVSISVLSLAPLVASAAWAGPTAAPPGSNVDAPVNVGSVNQVKNGGLGVNALTVFGNSLFGGSTGSNAYLNFGVTAGANGYGIRDNAGTVEFKNSGDTSGTKNGWYSLQELVFALCSGGACGGGGSGGLSGYQVVTVVCGGTNHCVATCPAGKKIVGGDCAAGSSVPLVSAGTAGTTNQYRCDYETPPTIISTSANCVN